MSSNSNLAIIIYNDLLLAQEAFGSEFIYEQHGSDFVAVQLDDEGDEVARYKVKVSLEKQ